LREVIETVDHYGLTDAGIFGRASKNEPAARARLEREVEALRELDHPHLVRFLGLTEDADGAPAIVMEAVDGPNLATVITAEGPLATDRAIAIAISLCEALEHLAGKGLVHRDVKPANVILRSSDDAPILVDFSVTKRVTPSDEGADLTRTGTALGTSAYMAPEQCAGDLGEIDARTDVYGLGALLFHALTGLPPWTHESGWERTQRNPWRQPYPAQPEQRARVEAAQAQVPSALGTVVARCLEGAPGGRFPDARALRGALANPPAPQTRARALALAVVALCAVMTYGFFNQASWLSPNQGQNQQETPMKTASLAAIATLTPFLALAGEPSPAPIKTPEAERASLRTVEASGELALGWLKKLPRREGAWLAGDHPSTRLTAKVLLAFSSHGHTHRFGDWKRTVAGGLSYLKRIQRDNGSIGFLAGRPETFLDHAWATLALCHAYQVSRDSMLKGPLERALRYGSEAQPKQPGVLAAVVFALALHESEKEKLTIPQQAWERIRAASRQPMDSAGAYLLRRLAGETPAALAGMRRAPSKRGPALYFLAAYVHQLLPDTDLESWGGRLTRQLLATQSPDGSWGDSPRSTVEVTLGVGAWARKLRASKQTAGLGEAFTEALAKGDETLFATLFRPKRPAEGAEQLAEALKRFRRLRARLVKAGLVLSEARHQTSILEKDRGSLEGRANGYKSNVLVDVKFGIRRLWLTLDDCLLESGRWWLTDSPSPRWLEAPQPTALRPNAPLISATAVKAIQGDMPLRSDSRIFFASSDSGRGIDVTSEVGIWPSQLPSAGGGVHESSGTVFQSQEFRSCGQFVIRYPSDAAADHAFALLVKRARGVRRRESKRDWTLAYVARARNVVGFVLQQDEGVKLPTKSAWLVKWLTERLAKCSSPAEVVSLDPTFEDSIGRQLLESLRSGDAEGFARVLRPRKPSYAVRARQTFTKIRATLAARRADLSSLRLVEIVDRAEVPANRSALTESDLYATFKVGGKTFTITLDDCVRVGNRWWLTGRLKPGR
ncbi:MAG: protein kinase, partial [Planctomycetes bacterium]|nr:protein kinase [Planctomycetota bacterium]